MRQKAIFALLTLALICGLVSPAGAADTTATEQSPEGAIVILHTNDVHCAVDDNIGYAGLAAYKKQMEARYGADYVTLVDAGDAIQGGNMGTVSQGSYLVDIMNQVGYDLAVPGNHEFDYGMENFLTLAEERAQYPYLSCNFVSLTTGEPVLEPYVMYTYGDTQVAYVGISTPETFTKSTPTYFQDGEGNYIYGFCEGEEGQALYDQVQSTVDTAREAGADYVVAVGHLGMNGITEAWSAPTVIAHTTGIDLFIDGHSHETYQTTVTNRDGEEIPLVQTGTKLAGIGQVVIDPAADTITCTAVNADAVGAPDGEIQTYIAGIQAEYQAELDRVVATSEVTLNALDEADNWLVRVQETNLGDLCADAFRVVLNADVGLMNGGGIRADIDVGQVTMGDILDVYTFGNEACLVQVTGGQLLDALEFSVQDYPEASGSFLQVSGLTYTINPNIPSHVVTNDQGEFVSVEGEYRVQDVLVDGQPLDLSKTYTVAGHNYMLKASGGGFTMFGKHGDTVILQDGGMLDNDLLARYITDSLGGVITAQQYGQSAGRITVLGEQTYPEDVDPEAWYFEAVAYVLDNGIMNGTGAGFAPGSTVTRGMVYQTLYNMEGRPAVTEAASFTDVAGTWYADAAAWAEDEGLTTGTGSGLFSGDRAMTRQELAKVFADYAQRADIVPQEEADLSGYTDTAAVADWALEGMGQAVALGIVKGSGTQLNPTGTAQRAELAQMLMNYSGLNPA